MKGIIFTTLNEMVEEKFGLEFWDSVLLDAKPPSEGVYTAGAFYSDSELFSIIDSISKISNIPASDLVRTYGEYLFEKLAHHFPELVPEHATLKMFLQSIDRVIHVEVRKLHPNAELPSMKYEDPAPDQLVILYQSPRKLCMLAEGLMKGAAQHFKETINIKEPVCIHKGGDHCRFELKFNQA
jgi:hypothetical protein